jgi:hypothetical protein
MGGIISESTGDFVGIRIPTIPECGIHALIVGIDLRAFNKAIEPHPELRAMLGPTPYLACLQWLFSDALEMFNRRGVFEPLAFVHETNDYKTQALQIFDSVFQGKKRGGFAPTLTFGDKADFVPLQAADVVAYELNKFTRAGRPDWSQARKALQVINPGMENFQVRGLDDESMPDMIKKLQEIRRDFILSEWEASRAKPS